MKKVELFLTSQWCLCCRREISGKGPGVSFPPLNFLSPGIPTVSKWLADTLTFQTCFEFMSSF